MKGLKGFSIGYMGVCKDGYFSISVGLKEEPNPNVFVLIKLLR
jgi:hypothetical protein